MKASILHALDVVEGLKAGRSKVKAGKTVKPADPAAVAAVLNFAPTPVQALIRLQWLTGARSGELVGRRPCDIDRETFAADGLWHIDLTEQKAARHGKARPLYLNAEAQAVLRPFLITASQTNHCSRPPKQSPSTAIDATPSGRR